MNQQVNHVKSCVNIDGRSENNVNMNCKKKKKKNHVKMNSCEIILCKKKSMRNENIVNM